MLNDPIERPPVTIDTSVKCNPYHFNAIREKPIYPIARLEHGYIGLQPHPNNWIRTYDEWNFFKPDKQFQKRTLFDADENIKQIHLRSIDSLTNQHLLDPNLSKDEDYVHEVMGKKRVDINQRNTIPEASPGDKNYKAVEYSPLYFGKNTHSRDPIKRHRRKKEITDLNELLNIRPSTTTSFNKNDLEYDPDELDNKRNQINLVKTLDDWQPAAPLKPPFKVLDLDEKMGKYRPKVTK